MVIEKIKILGAVLKLPAKQHCQFSPFGPIFEVNGLDWQCNSAGSFKTAPRILIFSIAIDADQAWPHLSPKFFPPGSFSSQFFLPDINSPWIVSSQALILLALYSPILFDNSPKTIYTQGFILLSENSPKTFSSKAINDSTINPPSRKFSQDKLLPGLNTPVI